MYFFLDLLKTNKSKYRIRKRQIGLKSFFIERLIKILQIIGCKDFFKIDLIFKFLKKFYFIILKSQINYILFPIYKWKIKNLV
jgi:hypothetical protein